MTFDRLILVSDNRRYLMRTFNEKERELLSFVPNQLWFTLKECCSLKGVNYKSCCNKTKMQPNGGRCCIIGGKKVFRRDFVLEWLFQTDNYIQ